MKTKQTEVDFSEQLVRIADALERIADSLESTDADSLNGNLKPRMTDYTEG